MFCTSPQTASFSGYGTRRADRGQPAPVSWYDSWNNRSDLTLYNRTSCSIHKVTIAAAEGYVDNNGDCTFTDAVSFQTQDGLVIPGGGSLSYWGPSRESPRCASQTVYVSSEFTDLVAPALLLTDTRAEEYIFEVKPWLLGVDLYLFGTITNNSSRAVSAQLQAATGYEQVLSDWQDIAPGHSAEFGTHTYFETTGYPTLTYSYQAVGYPGVPGPPCVPATLTPAPTATATHTGTPTPTPVAFNARCGGSYTGNTSGAPNNWEKYWCAYDLYTDYPGPEHVYRFHLAQDGPIAISLQGNVTGILLQGDYPPSGCEAYGSWGSISYSNAIAGTYNLIIDSSSPGGADYAFSLACPGPAATPLPTTTFTRTPTWTATPVPSSTLTPRPTKTPTRWIAPVRVVLPVILVR